jgi:hypothetical protein
LFINVYPYVYPSEQDKCLAELWTLSTAQDSVIGISVHGNLDVALRTCQLHRCSAAGLVFHVEMPFGTTAQNGSQTMYID